MICARTKFDCPYIDICNKETKNIVSDKLIDLFRLNTEVLLLNLNMKRVAKIEYIQYKHISYILNKYPKLFSMVYSTWNKENIEYNIILSKGKENLKRFMHYEHSDDKDEQHKGCGELLGYPSCCIVRFTDDKKIDENNISNIWQDKFFDMACPVSYNSSFYTHIPCSPICLPSFNMKLAVFSYIEKKYGIDLIKEFFSTHMIFFQSINDREKYITRTIKDNCKEFKKFCLSRR